MLEGGHCAQHPDLHARRRRVDCDFSSSERPSAYSTQARNGCDKTKAAFVAVGIGGGGEAACGRTIGRANEIGPPQDYEAQAPRRAESRAPLPSAADQGKLFQQFQQADNSITRRKGGAGLSKRIVEMHGGKIWVELRVGQGSTFAFTLPVMVEQQARPT